jgi:hypothetical protein
MASLRRIFLILMAFVAGNFLAVNVLLAGKVMSDFNNFHYYFGGLFVGYLLAVFVGTIGNCLTALIPTLLVLVFTETLKIRNVWFYISAGGLGASLFDIACTNFDIVGMRSFCVNPSVSELIIVTLAGIVAGYVFWRVAGNRSGEWRGQISLKTSTSVPSWH